MTAFSPEKERKAANVLSDRPPSRSLVRTMNQPSTKPTKSIDMLSGSLWDKIIIFAIPLAFTGVLQQMFNAADVAVLGHFVSNDAMAAVGNNVPIIGLAISLCMGLSLGANVVVARDIGMHRPDKTRRAVHTAFALALGFGLITTAVGELGCDPLLDCLEVPESVRQPASDYLRVFLLGMPFMAVYNFLAAVFRSKGDTKTPFVALVLATAFNAAANLVVVLVFSMGAGGVALTTVLANFLAAVYLFWRQLLLHDELRLTPRRLLQINKEDLSTMIRIGLPAGIQGMVFSLSNLLIQAAINSLGPAAMAGSVAAFTIEMTVYCFINAFGLATTTFVSQNYGAGNLPRCRRVTWISMGINMLATCFLVLTAVFFGREMIGLFSSDEAIIYFGFTRLLFILLPEPVNVIMETVSDAMRGYGCSLPPAVATLVCICTIRVVWVYTVFSWTPNFITLMTVYPISWIVTTFVLCWLYYRHQRELTRGRA